MEPIALAHYGAIASMLAASVLLVYQLIRQRMSRSPTIGTFSVLILFLLFGWLIVELLEITIGATEGYLVGLVHFLMMMTFAIGITVTWRKSSHAS